MRNALVTRVLAAVGVYDALGVHPSASLAEIKTIYRKTCLHVHPDKCKVRRFGLTHPFRQHIRH